MPGESEDRSRVAWAIAVPLVLLAGLLVVALRAHRELAREPDFTVDPSRWQLVGRPGWCPEPLAASVAAGVSAHVAGAASLLRQDELAWLSGAVAESSPWIADVERIDPRWPAQAEIRVRLRRPVLVTEGGLLVSGDGRPLGLGAVTLTPPPLTCSGHLSDADLAECAAAASELLPFRPELETAGVRLVAVAPGADDAVSFATDGGVELSWGRSAHRSPLAYLDLPVAARLANLRQVLADHPGLQGLGRVQLWTDRPVVVLRGG